MNSMTYCSKNTLYARITKMCQDFISQVHETKSQELVDTILINCGSIAEKWCQLGVSTLHNVMY